MTVAQGTTGLRLRRIDLRATGAAARDPQILALARRGAVPDAAVRASATKILDLVERGGAAAVREAGRRHGGTLADGRLVLERAELIAAAHALDTETRDALEAAIANVRRFA